MLHDLFILVISATTALAFDCPVDENRNYVDGTYRDPDYCQTYYMCGNGVASLQQCPPDAHFSPAVYPGSCQYTVCIESSNSACVDNAVELPPQVPELNVVDCPDFEQTLPSPKACNQYYHCFRGQAWPQECPEGQYFNPQLNVNKCGYELCVPLDRAQCPVNGGWGNWTEWSECQPNCGLGLRSRTRECDSPPPANGGDDCAGNNIEYEVCSDSEPCAGNGTAIFVSRVSDLDFDPVCDGAIDYERIEVNLDGSYDWTSHSFSPPKNDYFVISMSAQIGTRLPMVKYMRPIKGNVQGFGLVRTSVTHNFRDMISRDGIIAGQPSDEVKMFSECEYRIPSDLGIPTAWSIFSYEDLNVQIPFRSAFFAGMTTSDVSVPSSGALVFDNEVTNLGHNYDKQTGVFTAETAGLYFFSVSFGATTSAVGNVSVEIVCEGDCPGYRTSKLTRNHRIYTGNDIMSRRVVYRLSGGDRVFIRSSSGYYSDNDLITSFSGFAYIPSAENRIAWYLTRITSWTDIMALDPVDFEDIAIDDGSGWNLPEAPNRYTAPKTGYYFVFWSAGLLPARRADLRLIVNSAYPADLYRQSTIHDDVDTMSRTAIIHLNAGDTVRMRATGNSALYSSEDGHETSFGGIFLYSG